MRVEEFDKQMQQKLEGLNPVFNEKDWTRLSQKMKVKQSPSFFSKRISLLLLLLFLVLFSTWMSLRWSTIIPGTEMDNKVHKVETPLIIANTTDHQNNQFTNNNKNNNSSVSPYAKKLAELESNKTSKPSHLTKISNSRSSNVIQSDLLKGNNNNISKKKLLNNSSISNQLSQSNLPETTELNSANKMEAIDNKLSTAKAGSNVLQELNQNQNENNSLLNKPSDINDQALTLVAPIEILAIKEMASNAKSSLKSRLKPVAGVKPNKWIVGVTGLATANHLNTGLAFEVKTNKNISFGSGVIVQKYFDQNYKDQNAFTATNDADFTDLIRPRRSKSISFSNIKIRSVDVLVPLNLKYYYPLDFKYSLFANASMQLTMSSKTSLDFNYLPIDSTTPGNEKDFEQASNSSTLINHFSLGAGIQRDFGNMVFQLSFSFQKNNNNQPQIVKQEMAGQVGVFYKL